MKTILVLYVPVIHRGYLELIERYLNASCLYLLGPELVTELAEHVEIRALEPSVVLKLLRQYYVGAQFRILDRSVLDTFRVQKQIRTVAADEAIIRRMREKYFPDSDITFEKTFLRWEESKVLSLGDVPFDRVSTDSVDRDFINRAACRSERSSDWWRQVGAILVTASGAVFESHNEHVPTEYAPYVDGDPRDFIRAGTRSEFSSAVHAEKGVFAQALRVGVSTLGADLYVTGFPCPDCAKLVALSGVRRLFFKTGHASLDGVNNLKIEAVEIIKVE